MSGERSESADGHWQRHGLASVSLPPNLSETLLFAAMVLLARACSLLPLLLLAGTALLLPEGADAALPGMLYGLGRNVWSRQADRRCAQQLLAASEAGNSSTHFFTEAVLDHFGGAVGARGRTWRQRFHVDSTHWAGAGAPVFLYIGGEGTASPPSDRLFMAELAREHGALMLVLEHRYYGESFPVADMRPNKLRFLSSSQALADLAWFISWVSSSSPHLAAADPPLTLPASAADSAWVAFGGSYPGNLAAWLKIKYPHLLVGSVSSSAPVQAEYNFEQYAQVVGSALGDPELGGSTACFSRVEEAAATLRHLVTSTAPYGKHRAIPPALRPCGRLSGDMDLTAYEAELFGNFQGTVQYNEEVPGAPSVAELCRLMAARERSALEAFADVAALFHNQSNTDCVASSYKRDVIQPLKGHLFSGDGCAAAGNCTMERQWIYQSCREFGFFQTTTGPGHPFAAFASLTLRNAGAAICRDAFGITSPPQVDWSNAAYGGRHVRGTNITLVNGSMDPWHALGVVNDTDTFFNSCTDACTHQDLAKGEQLVFLKGTAHCRDMQASKPSDPPSVQWAHAKIRRLLAKWLGAEAERGDSLAEDAVARLQQQDAGNMILCLLLRPTARESVFIPPWCRSRTPPRGCNAAVVGMHWS
eukprot:jgi/Tetstr1/430016/TSEL_019877.t1